MAKPTGIPSLDTLLGGGIAQNTVLLLKSDRWSQYATTLLRIMLANALALKQPLFVVSLDLKAEDIVRALPLASTVENVPFIASNSQTNAQNAKMSIAWRYNSLPTKTEPVTASVFDLTKTIDPEILKTADIAIFDRTTTEPLINIEQQILEAVEARLKDAAFDPLVHHSQKKTLLIAIHSFCSPAWDSVSQTQIAVFLHKLRLLVRTRNAICVITIPAHLYKDFYGVHIHPYIRRIEHQCDAVIEVESFTGSARSFDPLITSDYHGLIHPVKLFTINSLVESSKLSNVDLHAMGFKVRRKRFGIETFQLPPENEDSNAKQSTDLPKNSCSSGSSLSYLDF